MHRPEREMVGLTENIQACLRIFRQAQHQWIARDILHQAQGVFYGFCLMARIGFQRVQYVQMVQGVQDVQMVQDVQKVQGVQLRPICIFLARMMERHTCCIFTAQLVFTYRYIFSESFYLYPLVNSQIGSIFAVQND